MAINNHLIASVRALTKKAAMVRTASVRTASSRHHRHLPYLWIMSDEAARYSLKSLIPHLPQGTGIVLRHYRDKHRNILAREVSQLCRAHRIVFCVANNLQLASALRAGLHWPEHKLRRRAAPNSARHIANRYGLPFITAATHSLPQLHQARISGIHAAFVSPVFKTKSHKHATILKAQKLARWTHQSAPLAIYALGGITHETARYLGNTGVIGFAGVRFGF